MIHEHYAEYLVIFCAAAELDEHMYKYRDMPNEY